ncbi:MAG: YchJ family metal-binding protein [Lysobacterales bacterium]
MSAACPCGRGLPYARCCEPLHAGAVAVDAEALMRSRYSAYVLGLVDYLLATWHPDTRPASLSLDPQLRWLGLSVRAHQPIDAEHAEVSFIARCRVGGGSAQRHSERSRFLRVDGRWLYVDGDLT